MMWLTWRQFRVQAYTAAGALIAFAVLLAATGPHLASLYGADGLGSCQGSSCRNLAENFIVQISNSYTALYLISVVVIILAPAVIGLFWGAPLIARELETGTSALAWNQSVTRARWLAAKLAVGGLAAVAVTEALCLMQAWWAAPISRAAADGAVDSILTQGRFSGLIFATHGITPLGYAAFAFALGVAVGALARRTVPAMAVTLAIFAAAQIAVPLWIRPNLFPARHATVAIGRDILFTASGHDNFILQTGSLPGQPGAWILSSGAVDAAGQPVSTVPSACTQAMVGSAGGPAGVHCLASQGIRIAVTYQPASRYWPLQWAETAIYLAAALALAGFCWWRLRRTPS